MLKDCFMDGFSFFGQSFSRFLPKRRKFFSRCLFWVPLHPFFHLPQEPSAPRPLQSWTSVTWSAFLGKPVMNIKKYIFLSVSKNNMDWTRKQDHHYTSWIPRVCIWDWARQGIAVFYGKTYSWFFHLPVYKCYYYWLNIKLLLARNREWDFCSFFWLNLQL